ncbi:MAG: ribosome maturation factor RimM [Oscillospiraceae bacterium]|jgi:16S rRNA processing protein RimM|nr:ribosome maturation factor RimM [Oscillospiraceae bacterium]
MAAQFLEAGKIVNTHGVRGAVKIQPWANTPEFLLRFDSLYVDGAPLKVMSASAARDLVLVKFEGVDSFEDALRLKNKLVFIDRADAELDEGERFIADLIGLDALDDATGESFGRVTDVLDLPAHDVYVVTGAREWLIPAVPEFVVSVDVDGGHVRFRLLEGL